MILIDTDIAIDILRGYRPALQWSATITVEPRLTISGYTAFELVEGANDRRSLTGVLQWLTLVDIVWLSAEHCRTALTLLENVHLHNAIGSLDCLIAQTALSLETPLNSFNRKHFVAVPGLKVEQPYERLT